LNLNKEAAVLIGVVATIILNALATLAGEGIISEALQGQLTDGVNAGAQILVALAPLIAGLLTRFQVFSKDTTQKIADRAAATGDTDIGSPPQGPQG